MQWYLLEEDTLLNEKQKKNMYCFRVKTNI